MEHEVETQTTFLQAIEMAMNMECICMQEMEGREAKKPRGTRGFGGAYSGGKGHHGRGYASRSVHSALQTSQDAPVSHGF